MQPLTSNKIVLIAVKNFFYVSELSTKNLSLVERECVKNKCDDFSLYVSAIHLAFYVEDIVAITDNSELQDVISILGDFNLPKVK
jgi:LEA14-like dessication related protein